MKRLVIATRNKGKKREIQGMLKGVAADIVGLPDLEIDIPQVVEDGKTFRQNAIKKALTFSLYSQEMVLAEDSGLAVDSIGGKPGIRSARFAHTNATDEENNTKLLSLMKNIPARKRQATFVCVAALAENGNLLGTVEGKCPGIIGFGPKGKNGFGYDPLFTPKGYQETFAELEASVKNKISHRGKAIEKMKAILEKHL